MTGQSKENEGVLRRGKTNIKSNHVEELAWRFDEKEMYVDGCYRRNYEQNEMKRTGRHLMLANRWDL